VQKKKTAKEPISAEPVMDQPQTADEMIDKYGTYNIQPTADSGNKFPTIAQGLPSDESASGGKASLSPPQVQHSRSGR